MGLDAIIGTHIVAVPIVVGFEISAHKNFRAIYSAKQQGGLT